MGRAGHMQQDMLGFLKAIIAEAKYRGIDEPHFNDRTLATFDDTDHSVPVPYKEARNIIYTAIYSAPILPKERGD